MPSFYIFSDRNGRKSPPAVEETVGGLDYFEVLLGLTNLDSELHQHC